MTTLNAMLGALNKSVLSILDAGEGVDREALLNKSLDQFGAAIEDAIEMTKAEAFDAGLVRDVTYAKGELVKSMNHVAAFAMLLRQAEALLEQWAEDLDDSRMEPGKDFIATVQFLQLGAEVLKIMVASATGDEIEEAEEQAGFDIDGDDEEGEDPEHVAAVEGDDASAPESEGARPEYEEEPSNEEKAEKFDRLASLVKSAMDGSLTEEEAAALKDELKEGDEEEMTSEEKAEKFDRLLTLTKRAATGKLSKQEAAELEEMLADEKKGEEEKEIEEKAEKCDRLMELVKVATSGSLSKAEETELGSLIAFADRSRDAGLKKGDDSLAKAAEIAKGVDALRKSIAAKPAPAKALVAVHKGGDAALNKGDDSSLQAEAERLAKMDPETRAFELLKMAQAGRVVPPIVT